GCLVRAGHDHGIEQRNQREHEPGSQQRPGVALVQLSCLAQESTAMNVPTGSSASYAHRQRGVALVVALVLLLVATLIGLAASRGTMLQERMSGNTFDRSLAFQRAESALRAAEAAISANWQIATLNGVDCSPTAAVQCPIAPADAFTGTSANWIDV